MGISGHFRQRRLSLGVMKTRESEFRFVANPRLVKRSGRTRRAVRRTAGDSRRLDERQCVRMLRGRNAVDWARAHFRSDVDGPGAAGAVRSTSEWRRPDPRLRRFCHRERNAARGPWRDPRRIGPARPAPICLPGATGPWRPRSPGFDRRTAAKAPQHP